MRSNGGNQRVKDRWLPPKVSVLFGLVFAGLNHADASQLVKDFFVCKDVPLAFFARTTGNPNKDIQD
ncbi:MAG: hypothetical protein ACPGPF_00440 [Pontibacterium sp.]